MSSWTHAVTGGSWYYNSDNTEIGLPIFTIDTTPSLSSYIQSPDITNIKLFWKFPQTAAINLYLPYPNIYVLEPDLSNVRFIWQIKYNKNYGLPFITEYDNYGAFIRCSNLSSVSIPVTVKKIGYYTFEGTDLSSVVIPADCSIHSTSFPQGCTITWNLLDLNWYNYELDTTTGATGSHDGTRLSCFNYIPIPSGMGVVGLFPNISLITPHPDTPQYLVCWYSGSTYIGYDDFTDMIPSQAQYVPIRYGADFMRLCIRYKNDSAISKSDITTDCNLLWMRDVQTTQDITNNSWQNKVCDTSDGSALTNSSTTLFSSAYFTVDTSAYKLYMVEAATINCVKLDYEVFEWSGNTYDGYHDWSDYGSAHTPSGTKMRIQLKKHDGSALTPDELAYVRIKWY